MKTIQETNQKKSVNNRKKTKRTGKHLFKKGQSGNPKGRPKGTTGSFSITGMVRDELQRCPEGEDKKTYADLVIKRIMSKAIKDGDTRMIERIWAYMDGLPRESHDVNLNIPLPLLGGQSNGQHNSSNKKTTSVKEKN